MGVMGNKALLGPGDPPCEGPWLLSQGQLASFIICSLTESTNTGTHVPSAAEALQVQPRTQRARQSSCTCNAYSPAGKRGSIIMSCTADSTELRPLGIFNSRLSLRAIQPALGSGCQQLSRGVIRSVQLGLERRCELETRNKKPMDMKPVVLGTEGVVRVQRNCGGKRDRSVWFGEKKGGIAKRPQWQPGAIMGRAVLEEQQGQMAGSEEVAVGVRK